MYVTLSELSSGQYPFDFMVCIVSVLNSLERKIHQELNTDQLINYTNDFAAFSLDDDNGMVFYHTEEGSMGNIYATMISKWGDDYDYNKVSVLDNGETVEVGDLRFIQFSTTFLARCFVEFCQLKQDVNPGKCNLPEKVKSITMAHVLRTMEELN